MVVSPCSVGHDPVTQPFSLDDLGWAAHFSSQLELSEAETLVPARVTGVLRDRVQGLTASGAPLLYLPSDESAGEYAVGDWVLYDPETNRITRRLDRLSLLQRRAAGTGRETQLIAANIDTLFIVTSCNADFNPARLERYLVLAAEAGVSPVIVLTKADTCDDVDTYVAEARAVARHIPVEAVNAKSPETADVLAGWLGRGRTGALLGSSGVGKTTLLNALTGGLEATADIREDDARGRHTTTARGLFAARGGAWLVDTPGMRAVRLTDAADGIDTVFSDLVELAGRCRFNDCAHVGEPGCAVQAAIAAGEIDPVRLARWQKLTGEEAENTATLHQARQRGRAKSRIYRQAKENRQRKEGI